MLVSRNKPDMTRKDLEMTGIVKAVSKKPKQEDSNNNNNDNDNDIDNNNLYTGSSPFTKSDIQWGPVKQ